MAVAIAAVQDQISRGELSRRIRAAGWAEHHGHPALAAYLKQFLVD